MRCPGGVNFSLNKPGGYQRGVETPKRTESADLVEAVNKGFVFFKLCMDAEFGVVRD